MSNAIVIGGRQHGRVIGVCPGGILKFPVCDPQPIAEPRPIPIPMGRFKRAVCMLFRIPTEADFPVSPNWTTETYRRRRVAMFGRMFDVYVLDGLDCPEQQLLAEISALIRYTGLTGEPINRTEMTA